MELDFDVTREEQEIILKIVVRAKEDGLLPLLGGTPMDLDMDLCATHRNGNPLQLAALLGAAYSDFAHDLAGIRRHIDRETGQLGGCFSPRYAA